MTLAASHPRVRRVAAIRLCQQRVAIADVGVPVVVNVVFERLHPAQVVFDLGDGIRGGGGCHGTSVSGFQPSLE